MALERKKAVVLVSGGLDSTTVLSIAKSQNYDIYAITFNYGQRHNSELEAAEKICNHFKVKKHITFKIDLRQFGGSALTSEIAVPLDRDESSISSSGIPITYVPARNTVFMSIALSWAETLKAYNIFIGVNAVDYSGYPDCRPEFIKSFQTTANLATKEGAEKNNFTINTPLIHLTKKEIILKGIALGVDYGMTTTCYSPPTKFKACGRCDACILRLKGFQEAKIKDPIQYEDKTLL